MAEGLPDPLGAAAAHVGARLVARHGQQRLLQEVVHIHVQCTCAHVQCTCAHVHMCTCTCTVCMRLLREDRHGAYYAAPIGIYGRSCGMPDMLG
jgi:hypothetical protein